MYQMSMYQMNYTTDAASAPACRSARADMALNLDTAAEAVSVLILGVLVLISVIVRILVPV